ncbi:hypothetical protein Taro_014233 [Colocasia esculenta]|uniref:Uncharacterized protein n=1 Tax=Colocasia esculenta TaxID=4460 RepID=A0A843UE51_COLES|nr:hypothetical protein [Colocasia esculenta]
MISSPPTPNPTANNSLPRVPSPPLPSGDGGERGSEERGAASAALRRPPPFLTRRWRVQYKICPARPHSRGRDSPHLRPVSSPFFYFYRRCLRLFGSSQSGCSGCEEVLV